MTTPKKSERSSQTPPEGGVCWRCGQVDPIRLTPRSNVATLGGGAGSIPRPSHDPKRFLAMGLLGRMAKEVQLGHWAYVSWYASQLQKAMED